MCVVCECVCLSIYVCGVSVSAWTAFPDYITWHGVDVYSSFCFSFLPSAKIWWPQTVAGDRSSPAPEHRPSPSQPRAVVGAEVTSDRLVPFCEHYNRD